MRPEHKASILRKLFLALWAWITLLLCFVLVLLVNEMVMEGRNPLEVVRPESNPTVPSENPKDVTSLGTKQITLFFTDESGHSLATESAIIEFSTRTVENCRKALLRLITGPKQERLMPIMPGQAQLRGLYLRANGELVIDLSTEMFPTLYYPRSTEMEALMAYGIVNTMMHPDLKGDDGMEVKQVRFLFDGGAPQEFFPVHIDLMDPLVQDKRWAQAVYE